MADALDIHAASPDEQAAAHRNVWDIWSKGRPLEEHVAYRMNSPKHRRAAWYVGNIDGRVVVSLAAYPLRFRLEGAELPGIAIGSVYTVKDLRGGRLAPRLLAWVEDHAKDRGARLSVLYSDINPDYYARRGYRLCPSLEGWCDPVTATLPATSHRLSAISPEAELPRLAQMYADYHGAAPLSIVRDREYWATTLEQFPGDRFFALVDPAGAWSGYVRITAQDNAWRIVDYALVDQGDELAEELYAAVLALGSSEGVTRLGGWLPESAAARQLFELSPRRTEITMVKPLTTSDVFSDEAIRQTSRFCEIDHV